MTTQNNQPGKPGGNRTWPGRRNVTNRTLLVSVIHRAIHDLLNELGDTENGVSYEVCTAATVEIERQELKYTRLQAELTCRIAGSLPGLFGHRVKNSTILRRFIRQAVREAMVKLGDTEDGVTKSASSQFAIDLELVHNDAFDGCLCEPATPEVIEFHVDVEMRLSVNHQKPVKPTPVPLPLPLPSPLPLPLPPLPHPGRGPLGVYGLVIAATFLWVVSLVWTIPDGYPGRDHAKVPVAQRPSPVQRPEKQTSASDIPPETHPEIDLETPRRLGLPASPVGETTLEPPRRLGSPARFGGEAALQPKPTGSNVGLACPTYRQIAIPPAFAVAHTRSWVASVGAGRIWVQSTSDCAKTTVKIYDGSNRLINTQVYGAGMLFQEQRLYLYRGADMQIDYYAADDKLSDRTMYVFDGLLDGWTEPRIMLAFKLTAKHERLLEARITRGADGSIHDLSFWTFGPGGSVSNCRVVSNRGEAAEVLRQFREFKEADQW